MNKTKKIFNKKTAESFQSTFDILQIQFYMGTTIFKIIMKCQSACCYVNHNTIISVRGIPVLLIRVGPNSDKK